MLLTTIDIDPFIIIIIYFQTSIFFCSARVRRSSQNEALPHIPKHCPFTNQAPSYHPSHIHTKSSFLYPPASRPCHHHISTGRHLIPTFTLHMPKPPQSTSLHHLIDALYTQKTVQIHTTFPILQRHSASHHHPFRSLI